MSQPLRLFISYSHKDFSFAEALYKHLRTLMQAGLVESWSDRKILPGSNWEDEIDKNLNSANVIIFMMSADFFDSEYINSKEMKRALERERNNEVRIIPILVRAVEWDVLEALKHLQAVPLTPDRKLLAITKWQDPDDAWNSIVKEIRSLANRGRNKPPPVKAYSAGDKFDNSFQLHDDIINMKSRRTPLAESSPAASPASSSQAPSGIQSVEKPAGFGKQLHDEVSPSHTIAQKPAPDESTWLENLADALVSWDLSRCAHLMNDPSAAKKDHNYTRLWNVYTQQPSPRTIIGLIQHTYQALEKNADRHSRSLRANLMALASRIYIEDPFKSRRYLKAAQDLAVKSHRVDAAASAYWRKYENFDKAKEFAREAIRKAKKQPEGHIELGIWAECEERWDEADSLFTEALSYLPTEPAPVWILQGPLAPNSGRFLYLAAKKLANQNTELALSIVDHALQTGFEGYDDGVEIEAASHHLRADLLSKIGAEESQVAQAYSRAGECYYYASQDEQAADVLRLAVDMNAQDMDAKWRLAEVLSWMEGKKYAEEGLRVWSQANQQCAPSPLAWQALVTRVRINDSLHAQMAPRAVLWESIAYLERAVALIDNEPSLWLILATLHRQLGNEVIGLEAVERVLAIAPDNALALEERFNLLANMGRFNEAKAAANDILKQSNNSWIHANRAWILMRTGSVDEAVKILENAVQQDNDNIWYKELLSMCYAHKGQWSEAAKLDEWIFKQRKKDKREDLSSYAWAALSMRQPAEAKQGFDLAIAETTIDPFETLIGSALASFALDQLEEGKQLLQQAIASATWRYQLDDFETFTLPWVKHLEETWPYGAEVMDYLNGTALQEIKARRNSLPIERTPLEEIENILTQNDHQHSVPVGQLATHARFLSYADSTDEAAVRYEELLATGEFPEARHALLKTHQIHAQHEEQRGDFLAAAASYEKALRRVSGLQAPLECARLHARFSLLCLVGLKEPIKACHHLRLGLEALLEKQAPDDAGYDFANDILADLVKNRLNLRKISAALRAVTQLPDLQKPLIEASRSAHFWLLQDQYWPVEMGVQSEQNLFPATTAIKIEVGSALVKDAGEAELLLDHLWDMRERIWMEIGVRFPAAQISTNSDLPPMNYVLLIDEVQRGEGNIDVVLEQNDQYLLIVQHLESVAREDLAYFVDFDECVYGQFLASPSDENAEQRTTSPAETSSTVAVKLWQVIATLLDEDISIVEQAPILDALSAEKSVDETISLARAGLREKIQDSTMQCHVLAFDKDVEYELLRAIRQDVCKRDVLDLSPAWTNEILSAIREQLYDSSAEDYVVKTQNDRLPPLLQPVLKLEFSHLAVVSSAEIFPLNLHAEIIDLPLAHLQAQKDSELNRAIDSGSTNAAYLRWLVHEYYNQLEDLVERIHNDEYLREEDYDSVYALGYNFYIYGRYSEALDMFSVLTQRKPENYYWRALGATYQQMGNYTDAISAYSEALNCDDVDFISLVYCAESKLLGGKIDDAREYLHQAVTKDTFNDSDKPWKERLNLLMHSVENIDE